MAQIDTSSSSFNIATIIDYLAKELGYDINSSYYSYIQEWRAWWEGLYKPFHIFNEIQNNKPIPREMFTLKMGKKVCEDWASILLNEKTKIIIDDDASSVFIQGSDDETGGVLGNNDFCNKGNALIEKAFYSGTGAIIIRLNGMNVIDDAVVQDSETEITLDYLPAQNIIPLTVKQGKIIDVAFASRILSKGKKYIYLETHILGENGYTINNQYFSEEQGALSPIALPEGTVESFTTGTDIPWFCIIEPNIVNNIDDTIGLGLSIFHNAVDNLKCVDLAFNNFCRDLKLSGKKVFYNQNMVQYDNLGNTITPDDVMQQLFVNVGDANVQDDGKPIQEYNPSMRIDENNKAIQEGLDLLSFKCGFGTKRYQFNAGSIVTATQYDGDLQELKQNANKHYLTVSTALKAIIKAVLWIGRNVLGEVINPDAHISIEFDDSYISNKQSQQQILINECSSGIISNEAYLMETRGITAVEARKLMPKEEPLTFNQNGGV